MLNFGLLVNFFQIILIFLSIGIWHFFLDLTINYTTNHLRCILPIQSDEIHPQSDPLSSIWQMSPPDPLRNIQHLSYFCLKTSGNGHFSANSGWAESNLLHAHLSSLSHEQRSAN